MLVITLSSFCLAEAVPKSETVVISGQQNDSPTRATSFDNETEYVYGNTPTRAGEVQHEVAWRKTTFPTNGNVVVTLSFDANTNYDLEAYDDSLIKNHCTQIDFGRFKMCSFNVKSGDYYFKITHKSGIGEYYLDVDLNQTQRANNINGWSEKINSIIPIVNIVPLKKGWNLIGFPVKNGMTVDTLASECQITKPVWEWKVTQYAQTNTITAGKAYQVYAKEDCNFQINKNGRTAETNITINLYDGWNYISGITSPELLTKLKGYLWKYVSGHYETTTTTQPYDGLAVLWDGNITLENSADIKCNEDIDCGNSTYGEKYCVEGGVFQNNTLQVCKNKGTTSSYCEEKKDANLIETCRGTCNEGSCIDTTVPAINPYGTISYMKSGDIINANEIPMRSGELAVRYSIIHNPINHPNESQSTTNNSCTFKYTDSPNQCGSNYVYYQLRFISKTLNTVKYRFIDCTTNQVLTSGEICNGKFTPLEYPQNGNPIRFEFDYYQCTSGTCRDKELYTELHGCDGVNVGAGCTSGQIAYTTTCSKGIMTYTSEYCPNGCNTLTNLCNISTRANEDTINKMESGDQIYTSESDDNGINYTIIYDPANHPAEVSSGQRATCILQNTDLMPIINNPPSWVQITPNLAQPREVRYRLIDYTANKILATGQLCNHESTPKYYVPTGHSVRFEVNYYTCPNDGCKVETVNICNGITLETFCSNNQTSYTSNCTNNLFFYTSEYCGSSGCNPSTNKCYTSTCTNECTSGTKRCNGSSTETCGNYDSDSCTEWGNKQPCNNGCTNGYCQSVTCSTNSNCGTNNYSGTQYCSGNSLVQNYRTYTCLNPGTSSSTCTSSDQPKTTQVCLAGCSNNKCNPTPGESNYCSPQNKCSVGQGGCKNNSDCGAGLRCVENKGNSFGYAQSTNVCLRIQDEKVINITGKENQPLSNILSGLLNGGTEIGVGCLLGSSGSLTSAGGDFACNVIPVIELWPDARDSVNCLTTNQNDLVEKLTCDFIYFASAYDLAGYAGAIVSGGTIGVGAEVGDVLIAGTKTGLKQSLKKLPSAALTEINLMKQISKENFLKLTPELLKYSPETILAVTKIARELGTDLTEGQIRILAKLSSGTGADEIVKVFNSPNTKINVGADKINGLAALVKGNSGFSWTKIWKKHVTGEISGGTKFSLITADTSEANVKKMIKETAESPDSIVNSSNTKFCIFSNWVKNGYRLIIIIEADSGKINTAYPKPENELDCHE
jgi:hypothetical protein